MTKRGVTATTVTLKAGTLLELPKVGAIPKEAEQEQPQAHLNPVQKNKRGNSSPIPAGFQDLLPCFRSSAAAGKAEPGHGHFLLAPAHSPELTPTLFQG